MLVLYTTVRVEDNASLTFTNNTCVVKNGALALLSSNLYLRNNTSITFTNNSVGTESGALAAVYSTIYFENNACGYFTQNSAEIAGSMSLWSSTLNMKHKASITLINNSAKVNGGALVVAGTDGLFITGLCLSNSTTMIFINNSANGVGGALFTFSTNLQFFTGTTIKFIGNSAQRGGAMALVSSYLEIVGGSSNISFENNSAKEDGGAILVQPDILQYTVQYVHLVDTHCLYKTNSTSSEHNFKFVNNSAKRAGDDVYGASLAWCNGSTVNRIAGYPTLSSISGEPTRVCRCDSNSKPLCANLSYSQIDLSFHPGEMITLLLVTVGGDWGLTPGIVHANIQQPSSAKIQHFQKHQWITNAQCTPVNYTVYSNQSVQMVLSAQSYTTIPSLIPVIQTIPLMTIAVRHANIFLHYI